MDNYVEIVAGAFDGYSYDKLKYWVNSLNQSGFKGHKVVIPYNCSKETLEQLQKNDIKIYLPLINNVVGGTFFNTQRIPVHVIRFYHFSIFLRNLLGQGINGKVVFTDMKDVIFQKNPMDFIPDNDVVLGATECLKYKDEPWGKQNIIDSFGAEFASNMMDFEIFNVGIMAGNLANIYFLADQIFNIALSLPYPICDQSIYNLLVHSVSQLPFQKVAMSEGWACNLGTIADPTKDFTKNLLEDRTIKFEYDTFYSSSGKEFHIVHQYDRNPFYKEMVEKLYG